VEPPIPGDNGITAPLKIAAPHSLPGWSEPCSRAGVRSRRDPPRLWVLQGRSPAQGCPHPTHAHRSDEVRESPVRVTGSSPGVWVEPYKGFLSRRRVIVRAPGQKCSPGLGALCTARFGHSPSVAQCFNPPWDVFFCTTDKTQGQVFASCFGAKPCIFHFPVLCYLGIVSDVGSSGKVHILCIKRERCV